LMPRIFNGIFEKYHLVEKKIQLYTNLVDEST